MKYLLLLAFLVGLQESAQALDSLRTENVNGKLYIIHRVDPQETLFALSRRYNISVDEIKRSNPIVKSGLNIGDIIRIPYAIKKPSPTGNKHTVKTGETLFAISQLYGVSVNDLRDVNELQSNDLVIGQELLLPNQEPPVARHLPDTAEYQWHVVRQGETLFALSRIYNRDVNELKKWNNLADNNINIGDNLVVNYTSYTAREKIVNVPPVKGHKIADEEPIISSTTETEDPVIRQTDPAALASSDEKVEVTREVVLNDANYEEFVETGLAELIQNSGDTRKYLALHRTAKIGTIIRVRNEMNGQEVFVRVLGKLPDTGVNDKVLLKISQAAYDRLGAIDKKFRVKISYFPD